MDQNKKPFNAKEFYTFLICGAIIGTALYVCFIICTDANAADPSLRGQAFGSLLTLAGTAMVYWTGSNKTSGDKDKTISDALNGSGSSAQPKPLPEAPKQAADNQGSKV